MSASKARSTRKQRSESEFAVSDKRNRVEDEFDLDLSRLVYTNLIILSLFVRFWKRSETFERKKMVESQWYQRDYVGAEPDQREGSEGRPEEERRDYFQVIRIVLYNLDEAVISLIIENFHSIQMIVRNYSNWRYSLLWKLDFIYNFYCDLVVLFENTWRISSIKVYYLFSFVYILKSENIMFLDEVVNCILIIDLLIV